MCEKLAEAVVEIPLTQGQRVLVNSADYRLIAKHNWYADRKGSAYYAATNVAIDGRRTVRLMHRILMDARPGQFIDHINGNGLDNRRGNLRFCNKSQNAANAEPHRDNKHSMFKGVSWDGRIKRWQAYITVNGKTYSLRRHKTELAAAAAYDKAALKHFGQYARLNLGRDYV